MGDAFETVAAGNQAIVFGGEFAGEAGTGVFISVQCFLHAQVRPEGGEVEARIEPISEVDGPFHGGVGAAVTTFFGVDADATDLGELVGTDAEGAGTGLGSNAGEFASIKIGVGGGFPFLDEGEGTGGAQPVEDIEPVGAFQCGDVGEADVVVDLVVLHLLLVDDDLVLFGHVTLFWAYRFGESSTKLMSFSVEVGRSTWIAVLMLVISPALGIGIKGSSWRIVDG